MRFAPSLFSYFTLAISVHSFLAFLTLLFSYCPLATILLVVGLIAHHHAGFSFYVFSAACGSTVGVILLSKVARKFGEDGIRKVAGKKQFDKLKKRIGDRSGVAVAVACLAPPPFPFTMVIAAASALGYSLWRVACHQFRLPGRAILPCWACWPSSSAPRSCASPNHPPLSGAWWFSSPCVSSPAHFPSGTGFHSTRSGKSIQSQAAVAKT